MAKSSNPTWSQVKVELKSWGRPQLLLLVKDLFALSAENRDFLAARLLSHTSGGVPIESYRRKIDEAFYSRRGWPQDKLQLAAARKAIRDYRTATSDLAGTLDLTLHYVETGTKFTVEFGDIDESFYNSLCSALDELRRELVRAGDETIYGQLRERLSVVAKQAGGIGWGYGDFVGDAVAELEGHFGRE